MESSLSDHNCEDRFKDFFEGVNNQECDCLLMIEENYINQTNHDKICGYKMLVCITVDNNSFSSCISHEIYAIWSIINIISCNMPIDDVDSHTP